MFVQFSLPTQLPSHRTSGIFPRVKIYLPTFLPQLLHIHGEFSPSSDFYAEVYKYSFAVKRSPETAEMSQSSGNVPLSSRQMQELLRGNHKNMVSIQASGEYICAIERVLAQHFSPVWRQRLENPDVKIVHIDIPNPAPAESLGEIPSENAPTGDTGIALTIGSGNEPSGTTQFRLSPKQNGNISRR